MSIKAYITDGENKSGLAKVEKELFLNEQPRGLSVYTRDATIYESNLRFASNETFGINMAQLVGSGDVIENIHDGADNSYWTASVINGNWTFNSTDQANSGSQSVQSTQGGGNNHEASFTKGSDIDSGDYQTLNGAIYLTQWPTTGTKDIEVTFRDNGVVVGNSVLLSNEVSTTSLNGWQNFAINLDDFNLAGNNIDEVRIRKIDQGGGPAPKFYLDDFRLEGSASVDITSLDYTIAPKNEKEVMKIHRIEFLFSAPYDGTLANSSMPKLAYDDLLGQSLTTGIQFSRFRDDVAVIGRSIITLMDLLRGPTENIVSFTDGTNTVLKVTYRFPEPLWLRGYRNDKIVYTVTEDLSGFNEINIIAMAGVSISER